MREGKLRDEQGVSEERNRLNIVVEPAGIRWRGLVDQFDAGKQALGKSVREWRTLTRAELNLNDGGMLVMTGHQPVLWHPGVLAKYFAVEAFAKAAGGSCANLVIDTHEGDFGELAIPVRAANGRISARTERMIDGEGENAMCFQKAHHPMRVEVNRGDTWGFVIDGLETMRKVIERRAHEQNAAMQMARAMDDLRIEVAGSGEEMKAVGASDLMKTSLWRVMAGAMAKDAGACARAYNAAAQRHSEARVEFLSVNETAGSGGAELPVWVVGKSGAKRRGFAADVEAWLQNPAMVNLQPRALLTTAIVRIGLADLFVHGRGGGVYDRIMEEWMKEWLGVTPAPMTVVSADVLLPLGVEQPSAGGVRGAIAQARRMEHDPPLNIPVPVEVGDMMGTVEFVPSIPETRRPTEWKQTWVRRIAGMERGSAERRAAYRKMHAELAKRREAAREMISQAREDVEEERRRSADWKIAAKRDWAFPLYPQAQMKALKQKIEKEFR
ncbi:MAG TPA: hypothetical protein VG711_00385 [Phycisphaerales bacterium]|nr:hypothetical protein [Phycisphaerales bacterium]